MIQPNLHSTMYLLNQALLGGGEYEKDTFTFHYVSIKSIIMPTLSMRVLHLHSTMYLLNQECEPSN